MKNKFSIKYIKKTIIYLFIGLLAIGWIYPFIWMISSSFKTQKEFFNSKLDLIPNQLSLDNFIRAWESANFSVYFKNSIIITISVVLIVLFITSLSGYVLSRYNFNGKKVVTIILLISSVIPSNLIIIPVYELLKQMNLSESLFGLILAEVGGGHVVFIMLFYGFFSSIPYEIEEAAILDGCNFRMMFTKIMLPLSKPVIATVVIMQGIWTWNSFLLPLIVTLNNPNIRTLSVGLYALRGENIVDWTGITAGACISVMPIIIVFIILQKYFINGIVGAVKS